MRNLAGVAECDLHIRRELERARIEVVEGIRASGEVPYTLAGKLGAFRFARAWTYWMVSGPMPLAVAKVLYADPAGRTDVRVAGHCGCPPPGEWATWRAPDGREIAPVEERAKIEAIPSIAASVEEYVYSDAPETIGVAFVENYHVDSELGLRLLADAIRALPPDPSR